MKWMLSPTRLLAYSCAMLLLSEPAFSEPALISRPIWDIAEDADQDGLRDVDELLMFGMDPLDPSDGLSDDDVDLLSMAWEIFYETDPDLADTDGDTWSDGEELLIYGTDPLDPQSYPQGVGENGQKTSENTTPLATSAPQPTAALVQTPPPPSLSNGEFNDLVVTNFRHNTGKDYQGKVFDWGSSAGGDNGWSGYKGSLIEVWKSGVERFIELDGWKEHYGVKQPIANVAAGSYVLTWQQSGRTNTQAGDNAYKVQVYYLKNDTEVIIANTGDITKIDKTKWTPKALGFRITAEQITDADGSPFYVAFIPKDNNTYGSLIDKVNLLSLELRDINDHANTEDDVTIMPWDTSQNIANNNIAWIDAHTSDQDVNPRMPQLEFRINGLANDMMLEAKLHVNYERGNGERPLIDVTEDEVQIPEGGTFFQVINGEWMIFNHAAWTNEIAQNSFFGGDAILTYRIMSGQNIIYGPKTINFRIGGENPNDDRCRTYIESLGDAGPNENLWYVYAIAKHESANYNNHAQLSINDSRYNQFYELPTHVQDVGRPLFGDDRDSNGNPDGPGGYGLFQVTGSSTNRDVNIPRRQIWDWRENVQAGVAIVSQKRNTHDVVVGFPIGAVDWMIRQKNSDNANGVALPDLTVRGITFSETANRTMVDAVTMKLNNGGSSPPSTLTDIGDVPGFRLDPHSSGQYCYWRNASSEWALSRFNSRSFNYVDRVCDEVE